MKSQTLINIMKITLVIVVIAALVVALWTSIPVPSPLATVSWNG